MMLLCSEMLETFQWMGKYEKKLSSFFEPQIWQTPFIFFRFILFQHFYHNIITQRVHFITSFTGNSPPDYSPLPTVPVRQDVIWKLISRPLYHVHFNVIRTHSQHNVTHFLRHSANMLYYLSYIYWNMLYWLCYIYCLAYAMVLSHLCCMVLWWKTTVS